MLTYNFENIGSDTLYEYLYKCIKNDIIQGKIKSGEKLPSKRALAKKSGHKCDHCRECLWSACSRGIYLFRSKEWILCSRSAGMTE